MIPPDDSAGGNVPNKQFSTPRPSNRNVEMIDEEIERALALSPLELTFYNYERQYDQNRAQQSPSQQIQYYQPQRQRELYGAYPGYYEDQQYFQNMLQNHQNQSHQDLHQSHHSPPNVYQSEVHNRNVHPDERHYRTVNRVNNGYHTMHPNDHQQQNIHQAGHHCQRSYPVVHHEPPINPETPNRPVYPQTYQPRVFGAEDYHNHHMHRQNYLNRTMHPEIYRHGTMQPNVQHHEIMRVVPEENHQLQTSNSEGHHQQSISSDIYRFIDQEIARCRAVPPEDQQHQVSHSEVNLPHVMYTEDYDHSKTNPEDNRKEIMHSHQKNTHFGNQEQETVDSKHHEQQANPEDHSNLEPMDSEDHLSLPISSDHSNETTPPHLCRYESTTSENQETELMDFENHYPPTLNSEDCHNRIIYPQPFTHEATNSENQEEETMNSENHHQQLVNSSNNTISTLSNQEPEPMDLEESDALDFVMINAENHEQSNMGSNAVVCEALISENHEQAATKSPDAQQCKTINHEDQEQQVVHPGNHKTIKEDEQKDEFGQYFPDNDEEPAVEYKPEHSYDHHDFYDFKDFKAFFNVPDHQLEIDCKFKLSDRFIDEIDRKDIMPQMSTPDDPVIHSPPSIGAGAGMNGYNAAGIKMEEPSGACASPNDDNADSSEESRRRQKTCRVCGDHATGYNFNVITCESCKAFFRRNALRPKEFKCPYSEDCEINSVSRRFCQKCRLRKCFTVGMKKEWILNEEQLRRRKNSRLNNTPGGGKRTQHHPQLSHQTSSQHPSVAAYQQHQQRPLSINSMENQMMHHMTPNRPAMQPLISPPGPQQYQLTSPVGSTSSDSPPSRNLSMMHTGEKSPDGYDPNVMSQAHRIPPSNNQNTNPQQPATVELSGKVVLSAEEYKSLLARIPVDGPVPAAPTEDEPTTKRQAYNCNNHPINANDTPPYTASMSDMALSRNNSTSSGGSGGQYFDIASFGMGMATATGGGDAAEEMYRKMNIFCDTIIQSALDSPETGVQQMIDLGPLMKGDMFDEEFQPSDTRCNYQLKAAELKALDTVKEAFAGMDDPMEEGRQLQSFLKPNKSPADIMNIMDVTMRRFVKVAKCCPAFREISQEGKFSLLKGGMIELLTIRGVTRFDAATNSFKTPTIKGVDVSVDIDDMFSKLNGNAQAQKEKCLEFFRFFDEEIKSDERAVHLVVLAVLFTVRTDPVMSENDVRIVTSQRNHFLSLLNRYLESLYGEGARRLFERLPKAMSMLNDIARNAGMLFMGAVRPGEAEELPREFFRID